MTNYNLKPPTTLASLTLTEKKKARKKLLEAVRKRRLQNAQMKPKHQHQATSTNEEHREYQESMKEEANLSW
jgi:hypothetical protein